MLSLLRRIAAKGADISAGTANPENDDDGSDTESVPDEAGGEGDDASVSIFSTVGSAVEGAPATRKYTGASYKRIALFVPALHTVGCLLAQLPPALAHRRKETVRNMAAPLSVANAAFDVQ